jgi:hypothetical protein
MREREREREEREGGRETVTWKEGKNYESYFNLKRNLIVAFRSAQNYTNSTYCTSRALNTSRDYNRKSVIGAL